MPITRPWTTEDIAKLEKLADEGATLMRASAALRRPWSAVQKKARELGKSHSPESGKCGRICGRPERWRKSGSNPGWEFQD